MAGVHLIHWEQHSLSHAIYHCKAVPQLPQVGGDERCRSPWLNLVVAAGGCFAQQVCKPTSQKCRGNTCMCAKHSLSPWRQHIFGRLAPCAIYLPWVGGLHPHGCSHGSLGPAGVQTNKPKVLGQHWHVCEALLEPMEAAQLWQTCTLCNLLAMGWGLAPPWVQPWQLGASRCANQQAKSAGATLACV